MSSQNQTLHIHPLDNVAIAKVELQPGKDIVVELTSNGQKSLTTKQVIPAGHKVALFQLQPGDIVRRYGQVIGLASKEITPGEHIHTHNLVMAEHAGEDVMDKQIAPVIPLPESGAAHILRISKVRWESRHAQFHCCDGKCQLFSTSLPGDRGVFHIRKTGALSKYRWCDRIDLLWRLCILGFQLSAAHLCWHGQTPQYWRVYHGGAGLRRQPGRRPGT